MKRPDQGEPGRRPSFFQETSSPLFRAAQLWHFDPRNHQNPIQPPLTTMSATHATTRHYTRMTMTHHPHISAIPRAQRLMRPCVTAKRSTFARPLMVGGASQCGNSLSDKDLRRRSFLTRDVADPKMARAGASDNDRGCPAYGFRLVAPDRQTSPAPGTTVRLPEHNGG